MPIHQNLRPFSLAFGLIFSLAGITIAQAKPLEAPTPPRLVEQPVAGEISSTPNKSKQADGSEGELTQKETKENNASVPKRPSRPSVRIHHQDKNVAIDELRVQGETQEIVVTPKGRMPAYRVRPNNDRSGTSSGGGRNSDGSTNGPRVWDIHKF